jgi:aprataxin
MIILDHMSTTHFKLTMQMAKLKASEYEPILKEDLSCFRCHSHQKNMPTLNAHLQEDWNKLEKKATKHTDSENENVT